MPEDRIENLSAIPEGRCLEGHPRHSWEIKLQRLAKLWIEAANVAQDSDTSTHLDDEMSLRRE